MKPIINYPDYKLFNVNCCYNLSKQRNLSRTTIVADWPFKLYKKIYNTVIKESKRILKVGGSLISIHYQDENYNVRKKAESLGFNFVEEVVLQTKICYKTSSYKLPTQTISILVMLKGNLNRRLWNLNTSNFPNMIIDANSLDIPTTFWNDKYFKNGYYNKIIGKHSEAMPRWVVSKIFDIFIPSNGSVLDLFCGSGNILFESIKRKIPCVSTEINKDYCKLIHMRYLLELV